MSGGDDRTERLGNLLTEKALNKQRDTLRMRQSRAPFSRRLRGGRRDDDLLERLEAVSRPGWSVEGILNDILPEQQSLHEANRLLRPQHDRRTPLPTREEDSANGWKHTRARKKRVVAVAPLRATVSPPHSLHTPSLLPPSAGAPKHRLGVRDNGVREHTLSLWEDKFRLRHLSVEDVLFLVAHANVASTLESTSFLREIRMSYDQVMELEMTLATQGRQQNWAQNPKALPEKGSASSCSVSSVCAVLTRNTWIHGRAFSMEHASKRQLPEIDVCKRIVSPRKSLPAESRCVSRRSEKIARSDFDCSLESARSRAGPEHRIDTRCEMFSPCNPSNSSPCCYGSQQDLAGDTSWPSECHPIVSKSPSDSPSSRLAAYDAAVRGSFEWVRDHCMEEIMSSPSSSIMRKTFAAEKLWILLSRHCHKRKRQRFAHWQEQMRWTRCQKQVRAFCRLKCALWVLKRSRNRLQTLVFRVWLRWKTDVVHQCEDERLAAVVTIQSWRRSLSGKRAAAAHHLHRAATLIQTNWRGFFCRKMLVRTRRFVVYSHAAHQIQRCYRSYVCRLRRATWLKQRRAARIITRLIGRYIEKRRDFVAWGHHLARYHAVIAIQIWIRRTTKRIARAKAERLKRASAGRTLHKFLRHLKFQRCFGMRVDHLVQRKNVAAVLLQNVYRAKQARAHFYELKVHLEEQRRQEILEAMWNNAYATSIQKWWRRMKLLQLRNCMGERVG